VSLAGAILLLGLSIAATPTERFVGLIHAGDLHGASTLIKGSVQIGDDMAAELGSVPVSPIHALELSKGCELSTRRTKSHGQFYRLWWNCGTEVGVDGALTRVVLVADVWPAGEEVLLQNLQRVRSPNEERVKEDLRGNLLEAKESIALLAAAGAAGNIATLRNFSGGVAFTPIRDQLQRVSIEDVAAKVKGCSSSIRAEPTLVTPGVVAWACVGRRAQNIDCYDIGYLAQTRGEGYPLLFIRSDVHEARCGPIAPPMMPRRAN
jgi:hypothetical protein